MRIEFNLAIVGAGPSGVHLAIRALREFGWGPEQLVLVDPRSPLELWRKRCANCGVDYLRSASIHHLDPNRGALAAFARSSARAWCWHGEFQCPSWQVFDDHCSALIESHKVESLWRASQVRDVSRNGEGFALETDQGSIRAKDVVLALGPGNRLNFPTWTQGVANVVHILDPEVNLESFRAAREVAVLGGGMTAVQAALSLSESTRVKLLLRNPIKVADFDVRDRWMGSADRVLNRLDPLAKRRKVNAVRRTGTINRRVNRLLNRACKAEKIEIRQGGEGRFEGVDALRLRWGGRLLKPEYLLLGTGFSPARPGGALVERLVENLDLPVSPCGYPLLSSTLEWTSGLYLMGPLAELQVGPVTRNLAGTRVLSERIVARLAGKQSQTNRRAG